MSSKTHFGLLSQAAVIILLLISRSTEGNGQSSLDHWTSSMANRLEKADYVAYLQSNGINGIETIPGLSESIPALDDLEVALQPWGTNKALENKCMALLMDPSNPRILHLNHLWGLYNTAIEIELAETDLPTSFQWLPAMLSQLDHAAQPDAKKKGMWLLSQADAIEAGLVVNGEIDERFIPESATAAAIQRLQQLQRRFPNDPGRVLVGYLKGMAFATRWTGAPGFDPDLDAWLALYKVISRLMVNLDLPDQSIVWAQTMSAWPPISCDSELTRSSWLADHPDCSPEMLRQLVPWWVGERLHCEVLERYDARLPSFSKSAPHSVLVQSPQEVPATEAPDGYNARFTCELHEVKEGDTLWNISKRYPGTTPDWIAEVNEIADYIRIGQVLCIPLIK
jgi:hypothetical protein